MAENLLAGLAGALQGAAAVAVPFFKTKLEQELIGERERKKREMENVSVTQYEAITGIKTGLDPAIKLPLEILAEARKTRQPVNPTFVISATGETMEVPGRVAFQPTPKATLLTPEQQLEQFEKREEIKLGKRKQIEEKKTQEKIQSAKPKIRGFALGSIRELKKAKELASRIFNDQALDRVTGASNRIPRVPLVEQNAIDLDADFEALRAKIGFTSLQQMRQNSPTGGAVGQVSDFEQKLFQMQEGSFDQNQSLKKIRSNIGRYIRTIDEGIAEINQKFRNDYGEDLFLPELKIGGLELERVE